MAASQRVQSERSTAPVVSVVPVKPNRKRSAEQPVGERFRLAVAVDVELRPSAAR